MEKKRLGMVIDTKRCIGCQTCAMVCKVENNLPDDIWWNRILTVCGDNVDRSEGASNRLKMIYITLACQHCENPLCVQACPSGATFKREEDGLVMQDVDKCIGCRYCADACPYRGVRPFNEQEPRHLIGFQVGDADAPHHKKHTVGKCTLCAHRISRDLKPACIEVCTARARHFGDFKDPESTVSQLILKRTYFQLRADKGTDPSVYFLK